MRRSVAKNLIFAAFVAVGSLGLNVPSVKADVVITLYAYGTFQYPAGTGEAFGGSINYDQTTGLFQFSASGPGSALTVGPPDSLVFSTITAQQQTTPTTYSILTQDGAVSADLVVEIPVSQGVGGPTYAGGDFDPNNESFIKYLTGPNAGSTNALTSGGFSSTPIPEPSIMSIAGTTGVLGLFVAIRKRRKAKAAV